MPLFVHGRVHVSVFAYVYVHVLVPLCRPLALRGLWGSRGAAGGGIPRGAYWAWQAGNRSIYCNWHIQVRCGADPLAPMRMPLRTGWVVSVLEVLEVRHPDALGNRQ